jgi:hypothetical protein
MSYSVTDIKTGLANALATIPGLRSYAQQPDNLNAPFAWPMLESITYNGAMRGGLVTHIFVVSVVVGRSAERTAQTALDGYLSYEGATSVRAALEADRSLGGVVQNLLVESASNISTMDGNDATYLMVDFRVVVYA